MRFLLALTAVSACLAVPIFTKTQDDVTVYTLEDVAKSGDCAQLSIPSADVGPAKGFDKNLQVGTCASAGYSVADGTTTKTVPVLGTLTVYKFKKAAAVAFVSKGFATTSGPSGTYKGTKSVLGVTVNAEVDITSAAQMSFIITGPASIQCANQAFSVSSDNKVILPTSDTCIYDALTQNKLSNLVVTYDPSADEILVSVKEAGIVTVNIVLTHQAVFRVLLAAPAGSYKGSKSILGITVSAEVKIDTATEMDLNISGAATISCANQAYTLSSTGEVGIPSSDTCIENALVANKLSGLTVKYDASANTITVAVKEAGVVSVTIILNHEQ
jgi:hypothetical protein